MSAQRIELLASASQVADGNSASFIVATALQAAVFVNITVDDFSDLDLWLQASNDDGTTWFDVPADVRINDAATVATNVRNIVDSATGVSKWVGIFKSLPYKHVRVKWDITGTAGTFHVVMDVK